MTTETKVVSRLIRVEYVFSVYDPEADTFYGNIKTSVPMSDELLETPELLFSLSEEIARRLTVSKVEDETPLHFM